MKKNRKVIIAIVGILIIAIFTGILVYNNSAEVKVRRQLKLGQRYLVEMNYEQAAVAFYIAIEIDPMSVEAYLGSSEAYVGLGDRQKALEVLDRGYKQTQDKRILDRIGQIRKEMEEKERTMEVESDEENENNDNYIEFDFSAKDFAFMGYSVLDGDCFENIVNENGLGVVNEGDNGGYDWTNDRAFGEIEQNNEKLIFIRGKDSDFIACYYVLEQGNIDIEIDADMESPREYVDSLFYPDDGMELVNKILKTEEIKKKGKKIDNISYEFESNLGKGLYSEASITYDNIEYPAMHIKFKDWGIEICYMPESNLILDISIGQALN